MKENTDKANWFSAAWQIFAPEPLYPAPRSEFNFDASLGRKHRFDFAWPEERVAVEVDGGQHAFHGGRHSTDADREKLNLAAALGWRVLRFSPAQLKRDPARCIELVLVALGKLDALELSSPLKEKA